MFHRPIAFELHHSLPALLTPFLGWVAYIFLEIKITTTILESCSKAMYNTSPEKKVFQELLQENCSKVYFLLPFVFQSSFSKYCLTDLSSILRKNKKLTDKLS